MNKNKLYSYNAMNAIQVFLAVVFQFLIARTFGIGIKTDIYFLSTTIITTFLSINFLFSEMFLQHYNDLYVKDGEEASEYYRSVYNLSLMIGVLIYIFVIVLLPLIARLFIANGNDMDRDAFIKFAAIQGMTLIWMRAYTLTSSLLNARMHFFLPYLLGATMQSVNIVVLFVFRHYGINVIAIAIVFSSLCALIVQEIYTRRKMLIPFKFRIWHTDMKKLMMNSFPLRLGHQVWSFKDLITTNVLTSLGVGMLSSFSYSWKILFTLFTVTNSPALQIYQSTISRMLSSGNVKDLRQKENDVLINTIVLTIIAISITSFILPYLLHHLIGANTSDKQLEQIRLNFFSLIPVFLVMSVEMPFVQQVICNKKSWNVLFIAMLFIVIYASAVYFMRDKMGVYGISLSMFMAQSINCTIYYYLARKLIRDAYVMSSLR